MTRLLGSLSTLRSAGYPSPTQDSLPAVDQTLPGRIADLPGRIERFLSWLHLFLLSQTFVAQLTAVENGGAVGLCSLNEF